MNKNRKIKVNVKVLTKRGKNAEFNINRTNESNDGLLRRLLKREVT
jgi:hypothetical protein